MGSVKGSSSSVTDVAQANAVAAFRRAKCAGASAAECSVKVNSAVANGQFAMVGMVVVAMGGSLVPIAVDAMAAAASGIAALASEAKLIASMGAINYCTIKPDTCTAIAEVALGLGSGATVPSLLPTALPWGGKGRDLCGHGPRCRSPRAAEAAAAAARLARSVEQNLASVEGKVLTGPLISHTMGKNMTGNQSGKAGEQVGLQALNDVTGRKFAPLQNASDPGADGLLIDDANKTIYMAEVKSSQNGLENAGVAMGDPTTKLDAWARKAVEEAPYWRDIDESSKLLALRVQEARRLMYTIVGIQVQVAVPVPSRTQVTKVLISPWEKP